MFCNITEFYLHSVIFWHVFAVSKAKITIKITVLFITTLPKVLDVITVATIFIFNFITWLIGVFFLNRWQTLWARQVLSINYICFTHLFYTFRERSFSRGSFSTRMNCWYVLYLFEYAITHWRLHAPVLSNRKTFFPLNILKTLSTMLVHLLV